ncbi:LacI family DNA-binding transcriptional regulator [Gordonia soli]|uniref:Putative LacI family transcriptional regulator n=1 Tax=Gordonia soli NBRC 108243 TaxID=1223545 RepID=M0QDZ8_9ACTN|nr:LacI family DNA-binding transcriptional regulator [Gordonia soli]GAC66669.1 putative LacI family transcriptional regulator [Gordonia soli NBRC 108243]
MADVAAQAGVSRTLVSFVLDGKPGASEDTKRRVLAVAAELGYRPDAAAQLLALGRSRTLGVLLDMSQLFEGELVTNIYPAAEAVGHDVLLTANLRGRTEAAAMESLLSHRCGALILLGPSSSTDELVELSERAPLVVVGRRLPKSATTGMIGTVRTNDTKGMGLAVDYLVDLGHRDIAHVDGGDDPGSADRRNGYRAAMRRHGLDESVRVIPGAHTEEAGAAAGQVIMRSHRLPTAILAGNDRCALGLLDVFSRAGIRVPDDISLMGYDDSRLSDSPRIDLSTVHQDADGLATRAVETAVGLLGDTLSAGGDIVLEPTLRIRGTTTARADA